MLLTSNHVNPLCGARAFHAECFALRRDARARLNLTLKQRMEAKRNTAKQLKSDQEALRRQLREQVRVARFCTKRTAPASRLLFLISYYHRNRVDSFLRTPNCFHVPGTGASRAA